MDKTPKESLEFGYNLPEDKMELYGLKNQQTQIPCNKHREYSQV